MKATQPGRPGLRLAATGLQPCSAHIRCTRDELTPSCSWQCAQPQAPPSRAPQQEGCGVRGALCPPEGPLLEGSSALTLSQRLIFRGCNELWKDKNAQRRWCFHRSVANESRLLVNPGSENTARPSPAGPTGPRLPSPPPTRRSLLRVPSPPQLPPLCFPAQRSSPSRASSPSAFDLFPLPSCRYSSFLGSALLSIPNRLPCLSRPLLTVPQRARPHPPFHCLFLSPHCSSLSFKVVLKLL